MAEQSFELGEKPAGKSENAWTMGPKDFIFKYLKYLPWVIICAVFGCVLAYIKLRYSVPIYRVQSALLIKDENEDNGGSKDQRFSELFMSRSNVNLSNETAILMSSPVLRRVAANLDLQTVVYSRGALRSSFIYPISPFILHVNSLVDSSQGFGFEVNVLNDKQFTLEKGKTVYTFGQPLHLGNVTCTLQRNEAVDLRAYPRQEFTVGWQPLQNAAFGLIGALRVAQTNDQATILNLTFDNESPALGVAVLNTLMSVYDSLIVEDKSRIAINTEHFIDTRLVGLKADLNQIEGNVKNDMEKNQTFDVEDQSKKYVDNISDAEKNEVEMNVKLKIANFLSDYVRSKENGYKLVPTNLGIEEPVLVQLVTEYNHLQLEREATLRTVPAGNTLIKGLEASIEKIRKDILEALQNEENAYKITLGSIENSQGEIESRLRLLPGKSMQLLNIQRQQKILEELYSYLLQKKIENSISSASAVSNSKVLEPARGYDAPISPDGKKIYTFYLMLGILTPVGLIVLIEVLKDKVGSRMEVEKRTSAPILGEIGHSDDVKSSLVVTKNSRSLIAEQFRIIRTNLQYVTARKEKVAILVTSSFSGEGKSFISTNIGAVMALSGKKSVIMEFDIRKPKIVSGLDIKRKMGITNYIIGKASFADLPIKVDGFDNLYVIPCGPIPPNPAEILLDKKLDDLMEEVKANFEVIIMDTAPVGLVSDAVNLMRFTDCTIFVIRQGYTFKRQLSLIEDLYVAKKLPSLSVLLNDVKAGAGYYGGYGYYGSGYGYGMASGYFEDESGGSWKRTAKKISRWWKQKFGG